MAAKSSNILLTPLLGGKSEGGVCSLLEIGGYRILLDCGCSCDTDYDLLLKLAKSLSKTKDIDAVIISHADLHHIGGLPALLGKTGFQNVPVICTLPVSKFGQIVLYDQFLNKKMEGDKQIEKFDADDIDLAFKHVQTVKFSQTVTISKKAPGTLASLSLCALPSGRTIGGSIWQIRCGPAEVLYTMDVNLRRETVLDGASLDLLPSGPALLIVEGAGLRKKKEKDESAVLISSVMETLRGGGNVLLPCETGGRVLELMQLLGKHWLDHKLGMYNLVFLSHMARNVPEFGRMQLEWMSDALSRGFFNGKPNPFELPQVRFVTSVRELERSFPGPKVVIATDASLSFGLSKELLLRWGGDPRCRVVFTDTSDSSSLAAELRSKYHSPPVISTLTRPVRVELVGEELAEHRREAEKARKIREEAEQRKRRQEELALLNATQDEEEDNDSGAEDAAVMDVVVSSNTSSSSVGSSSMVSFTPRKRAKTSAVSRLIEPNVVMFESRETAHSVDDYGVSNEDLSFRDISSVETKWAPKEKLPDGTLKPLVVAPLVAPSPLIVSEKKVSVVEEVPWKLVASRLRVQFTCDFQELALGARADLKAVKTLTAKVSPARLIVLRGGAADCDAVVEFARSAGIEAYAPVNNATVSFAVLSEKLKVQIPQSLLRKGTMQPMRVFNSTSLSLADTKCTVSALGGKVAESRAPAGEEGTRLVKYQGVATAAEDQNTVVEVQQDAVVDGEMDESGEAVTSASLDARKQKLELSDPSIGVVSVGEVTMNSLRQLIASYGVPVDFRLGAAGGTLVCGGQVVISKGDNNEFVIEGPPVPAYYEARRALYQQFAFV